MKRVVLALLILHAIVSPINGQQSGKCRIGWTYFERTNYCYKVFGGDDETANKQWPLAEQYCNGFDQGHLVSIHSDDENTFVVGTFQG